ncbi:MAG: GatB/YqeY domain-containing protein [Patescibacteria group bacterium]
MIKDQLQADLKAAMKSGDAQRKMTVSMALSVVKNRELEKRTALSKSIADTATLEAQSQLTDEEVIQALGSEIKKRREAITTYEQASRQELADKERAEIDVLAQYLPEQMSSAALKQVVEEIIKTLQPRGLKDMGRVISAVMAKVKGRADGQAVNSLVKEHLATIGS